MSAHLGMYVNEKYGTAFGSARLVLTASRVEQILVVTKLILEWHLYRVNIENVECCSLYDKNGD